MEEEIIKYITDTKSILEEHY